MEDRWLPGSKNTIITASLPGILGFKNVATLQSSGICIQYFLVNFTSPFSLLPPATAALVVAFCSSLSSSTTVFVLVTTSWSCLVPCPLLGISRRDAVSNYSIVSSFVCSDGNDAHRLNNSNRLAVSSFTVFIPFSTAGYWSHSSIQCSPEQKAHRRRGGSPFAKDISFCSSIVAKAEVSLCPSSEVRCAIRQGVVDLLMSVGSSSSTSSTFSFRFPIHPCALQAFEHSMLGLFLCLILSMPLSVQRRVSLRC